jgi:competence protein ComFC
VRIKKAISQGCAGFLQMVRASLFLPRCRLCGLDLVRPEEKVICRNCREKIVPAAENQCRLCGKFVPAGIQTCGSCLLRPPPYLRHVSYAAYEETLREIIILYKYGEVEPLKIFLSGLYLDIIKRKLSPAFDAVVPVPADLRRRHGFQPVRAMGRVLAGHLGIEFMPRLLLKKKHTPPQVGLTQVQRKNNLDGAFTLAAGKKPAGLRVLLIDDVTTTGTTIKKCAAVLKKGGARVTALTLAQSRF